MTTITMTAAELTARREALAMTQQELADTLGYSRRMVRSYEHGEAPIPPVVALAMDGLAVRSIKRRVEAIEAADVPPIMQAIATVIARLPQVSGQAGYAVYDATAVWGIGTRISDALWDACAWLDGNMPAVEGMQVAPVTKRLHKAVHAKGGDIPFKLRRNGLLDLADAA